MSNSEEDTIIQQDQEQHPNCAYSRSLSTRCTDSGEGELVCDSLRSIMRLCPGEQATNIYKYSEKTAGANNNNDDNAMTNPFSFPFRGSNGGPPSLDVLFDDDDFTFSMPSILDSIFSDMLKPFDKFPNVERGKVKNGTTNKEKGSFKQGPIEKV